MKPQWISIDEEPEYSSVFMPSTGTGAVMGGELTAHDVTRTAPNHGEATVRRRR